MFRLASIWGLPILWALIFLSCGGPCAARTILPTLPDTIREKWTPAKDKKTGGPIVHEAPHQAYLERHRAWTMLDDDDGSDGFCFLVHGCWGGFNVKTQTEVSHLMTHLQTHHRNPYYQSAGGSSLAEAVQRMAFVVAAGDNFYKKGVTSEFDPRFYTTFETTYPATAIDTGHHYMTMSPTDVPWLVALGNHDYRLNFTAQIHYTTLKARQQDNTEGEEKDRDKATALAVSRHTDRWFLPFYYYAQSYHQDLLLMIVLDCPLLERCAVNPPGSPRCFDDNYQLQWVKQVLESEGSKHLFRAVVCHYPMHANGPHVNYAWLHRDLQPLLEKHKVQVYYNADNHYMQMSSVPHGDTDNSRKGGKASFSSSVDSHELSKDATLYVNSGGGGGYMPHTRKDKGYHKNKYDIFEAMAMGVTVQCLSRQQRESTLQLYDLPSFQRLGKETTTAVKGGGSVTSKLKPRFVVRMPAGEGGVIEESTPRPAMKKVPTPVPVAETPLPSEAPDVRPIMPEPQHDALLFVLAFGVLLVAVLVLFPRYRLKGLQCLRILFRCLQRK